jgi:hypothetical protein
VFTVDVDALTAELFEGVSDGAVVYLGVAGGHPRAGVTGQLLDDVLGDAGVDQSSADSVTKLVGVDPYRSAGFVAKLDASLPAAELAGEAGVGVRLGAIGVLEQAGEQPWGTAWPAVEDVGLLGSDGVGGFGAQRDELFGSHLAVGEPQARPARAVLDDRVEVQHAGVTTAQAGLDEQHDEVADRRVGELVQVGIGLKLVHHELGDELGETVFGAGDLFAVEHGVGGQTGELPVAVAPFEEPAQHGEGVGAGVDRPRS